MNYYLEKVLFLADIKTDIEYRPLCYLLWTFNVYYISVIKKDLDELNRMLIRADSVPPISHFGYNYFSLRDSIQFIDNANVSSNYILGYGDEVIISIWGQAEQHERIILDRDGTVFVKNVGLLYLGSISLAQQFNVDWIYVAVGVALLQIASPLTKFCPVYTILNKLMPDTKPIQNGK